MALVKRIAVIVTLLVFTSMLVIGCGQKKAPEQSKAAYPNTNINGIIAWGAGGGTDNTFRALAPLAEKALGKSIILSNKTGATGALAAQYVYDQKTDGYTLLFHAENPQLYPILGLSKLTYDDFEPIMLAVQGVTVIIVPKDSPYNSLADLVAAAKKNPGKVSLGISGVGGQPYVTAAILKSIEGVSFSQVAFDGDGPLTTALLGKQIDATGLAVGAAAQYIRNGDVKALAVMANERNASIPNVPAISEQNPKYKELLKTPGYFYGVFVKKGTPEDAVKKLTESFTTAFKDPKFQEFCQKNGMVALGLTGKEAKDYVKTWQKQMSWLIYQAGGAKESPEKFGIPKP